MKKIIFILLFCFCIQGCATPPTDPDQLKIYNENNDPLEPYNRFMTKFNFKVNRYVYQPIAKAYRTVLPERVRTSISNFSDNLSEPYTFVNAVLQGEFSDAAQSFGRFFTNTTIGVGGLFDAASYFGIENPEKTFGQTLYKWGWKDSAPYIVLPFLGPSDLRETIGMVAGWFMDPVDYTLPEKERLQLRIARYVINGFVTIDQATDLLTNVEETSLDPYATLRTYYRQNHQKFLDGKGDYEVEFDFDDEDEEEE